VRVASAVRTGPDSGWVLTADHLDRTVDGGATWTTAPVPTQGTDSFRPGELFVIGETAWLATVSPGGDVAVTRVEASGAVKTSALPARYPGPGTTVWIGFADTSHGWTAVADQPGNGGSTLYATSDGGQSWRLVGHAPVDGPLHPVDDSTLFALGSRLWRSDDAGVSWHGDNPPATPAPDLPVRYAGLSLFGKEGILQVDVATGMMGYAVFDVTADGGRTWSSRSAPQLAGFNNTGPPLILAVSDPDHWHLSLVQRLWTTSDAGRSWKEVSNGPPAGNVVDLSFPNVDDGWAVVATDIAGGGTRVALSSDDGGAHWSPLPVPSQ
jgi:photosystem II stability/assembly factor-like uncharacterized protein